MLISTHILALPILVVASGLPVNHNTRTTPVVAEKPWALQLSLNEVNSLKKTRFDFGSNSWTHFDDYGDAYRAAQIVNQPLLIILNPSDQTEADAISIDDVRKTRQRRKLLSDYVVAVIDTGTEHGKKCHELFGNDPLPHVVVIDKNQKFQMFQTSEEMYGQLWTEILASNREGEYHPPQIRPASVTTSSQPVRQSYPVYSHCPT